MADRSIMEDPAVRTFQEQRAIVGNPASQTVQSMYWSESARRKRGPPTPVASSLATPQEEIPAFDHTAPSLVQPWLLEDSAAAQVTAGTFGVQVQDQQAMEAWTCPPALPSSPALTPCPPPLPSSPALLPCPPPRPPPCLALLPCPPPCPPPLPSGASPVLESPAFSPDCSWAEHSFADSGCGSLSGGRRRLGSSVARGNSFEKASFSWGCFWIRGACLWNSWECSAWEPFPSSWRVILSRAALDQSHDGGSGPPLEGSGGGRACERSSSHQRAKAIAFPLLWNPRECGRHVGFCVGGRQYSWASFAGFGKPFWIVWCSDRASWDSSPFRVWGSNASSCEGDGGLSRGSGTTFPEASHGRGCYTNNGRRNSLEPVAGQSSCWEGSCRAWAEDFGLRGKQAHSGVHASAFGGARVPIEGPEESSRPHGCRALYYPCRILLPELPAGTSGLQRPSWRAGGKDAPATSQRVGKGGGPSLEDFGSLGGLPNGRCEEKGRREKGSAGGSSLLKIGHGKGGGLGICPFALDVRLFVGRGSLHSSTGSRGDEPCRRSAGWEDVEISRGYGGLLFEGLAGVIQHWPSGRCRASLLRGPGGNLGAPFAQESGGGVSSTVGGPGDGHCRRVQSPAGSEPIGVPGLWSSSSSSCPEALPAANATPCSGMELRQHRACLQRQRVLQWHRVLQRQRAKPSERRVSSCRLLRRPLPRHLLLRFRRRPTSAFPDFQTVAAGAREAIRSGREALDEESSELE